MLKVRNEAGTGRGRTGRVKGAPSGEGVTTVEAVQVMLDRNGRIVDLNRQAVELLGVRAQEAIGRDWFSLFIPGRERKVIKEVFKDLDAFKAVVFKCPFVRRGGTKRVFQWEVVGMKANGRDEPQVICLAQDVTESEKALELIEKYTEELERFSKVQISRELRMEELRRKIRELERRLAECRARGSRGVRKG